MLIGWSSEFDRWLSELERRAEAGYGRAREQLDLVTAQLEYLQDLKEAPTEDTPTLKRVRQSGRFPYGGCRIPVGTACDPLDHLVSAGGTTDDRAVR
ncbi:hypothetical protein QEZ54_12750 [Catellatospora sp. KI3]|uniref:hypothetical protein n=1 Tax=Catellatospora sp. KI3 TaxID=3041620 RepID=UPI002482FB49|nr:hypothetical protein [Catellatospora sp. KI3]MDI1461842.1 hypothetical protein [Catellatospora sp. KI3]